MRTPSPGNCSGRESETVSLLPLNSQQTPLLSIVCFRLNMHECEQARFIMCAFGIVYWKLWTKISSVVYSPASCGAGRPSVVSNPGEGKRFNKRPRAWSSQVITPSHRHSHIRTHSGTHTIPHFEGGSITMCLPHKGSELLAWSILPHPDAFLQPFLLISV